MNNEKYWGYLSVIISNSIIGLSFLFTKKAVSTTDPYNTLAMRFAISFFVIFLAAALNLIKLNFKGKDLKKLILLSIFFPSSFFLLQSFGLKWATSSEAGIISALTPAMILVFSILFLKEKVNLKQVLSIMVSICGVVYIFCMKGNVLNLDNFIGIFLIFLSCVCFAIFSILSRKCSNDFTPMEICFFMQGFGFILFSSLAIFRGFNFYELNSLIKNTSFVTSIIYLAIPSTLFTAILNNYSLSKIEASKVGVFSNISTIISIIAGALILKEQIMYYHIIGSILIIGGIIGVNCLSSHTTNNKEEITNNKKKMLKKMRLVASRINFL
ncbi:DMT family transporter [Clostridium ganghwense]|uniref:DMT family transporter n=1 Tax=Clostridium ganghwense TaxID=312089 RepID=A0ABT4CRL7_9CLOT|nr:DMT family transporter [Clostridium ganghwense]MCY6371702.1 DMT family transporter [Clostridium ganghwense]